MHLGEVGASVDASRLGSRAHHGRPPATCLALSRLQETLEGLLVWQAYAVGGGHMVVVGQSSPYCMWTYCDNRGKLMNVSIEP